MEDSGIETELEKDTTYQLAEGHSGSSQPRKVAMVELAVWSRVLSLDPNRKDNVPGRLGHTASHSKLACHGFTGRSELERIGGLYLQVLCVRQGALAQQGRWRMVLALMKDLPKIGVQPGKVRRSCLVDG